jgi:dTDP-glucose 4,6-dehydratase
MLLLTGVAGFIGSNFALNWLKTKDEPIIGFDKLTYAGNLENLEPILRSDQFIFAKGDVVDSMQIYGLLNQYKPRAIVHFAAETHVDRSILGADDFIKTNVEGTYSLLKAAFQYWSEGSVPDKSKFRFIHVSTDEVFGTLESNDQPFTETSPYKPNSPYSASKASSDHLVRAWYQTYKMPTLITNCSNNYGPYQYPEKLIPLIISNALNNKPLPIYGDGKQVRDWIYVEDHCRALMRVLEDGRAGQQYCIGGDSELQNIKIVNTICEILDKLHPSLRGETYKSQIVHVRDRPGHDRRYAINSHKIKAELGWKPEFTLERGLLETIDWYLKNTQWLNKIKEAQKFKLVS